MVAAAITAANGANRHGLERFAAVVVPACLLKIVVIPPVIPRPAILMMTQDVPRDRPYLLAVFVSLPASISIQPRHDHKNDRRWCRSAPSSGRRPRARHSAGRRERNINLQLHRLSQHRPRCRWSAKKSCLGCLSGGLRCNRHHTSDRRYEGCPWI